MYTDPAETGLGAPALTTSVARLVEIDDVIDKP